MTKTTDGGWSAVVACMHALPFNLLGFSLSLSLSCWPPPCHCQTPTGSLAAAALRLALDSVSSHRTCRAPNLITTTSVQ
jgi:hypothetical protein